MKKIACLLLVSSLFVACSTEQKPSKIGAGKTAGSKAGNGSGTAGDTIKQSPNGDTLPSDTISGQSIPDMTDDPAGMCGTPPPGAPKLAELPAGKMIPTVSAGRVRLRHESNGLFGHFGDHYWEFRSFEFLLEDYTPTGEKRVVITLKPLGVNKVVPNANRPNLRYFSQGTGDPSAFDRNEQMPVIGDNIFQYEIKEDGQAKHSMAAGKVMTFEFGFFFNPDKVKGNIAYYSDTFRYVFGKQGIAVGIPVPTGDSRDTTDPFKMLAPFDSLAGGDHSFPIIIAEEDRHLVYSQGSNNSTGKDTQAFLEGRSLFHSNFVTGEHSEKDKNFEPERVAKQKGLAGPSMDAAACSSCHNHNGSFSADETDHPEHIIKVVNTDGSVNPKFGLQLQKNELAQSGIKKAMINKEVALADGTKVTLSAPNYTLEGALVSARIPQMVYGMGLLEAISNETIMGRAACNTNAPGVSGKAAVVLNPKTGKMTIGRFGWKASKVSLEHQVSEAALLDLGVTSPMFPSEDCEKTGKCVDETPELPQDDINRLVGYMRGIAVPVQRNTTDAKYLNGRKVFESLGCPACHVPTQYTSNTYPIEKLRNQTIRPFTDLLLHDMGPGLADGKPEGSATGREWRTPPLWGIGLMKTVNGQVQLLHDGRAKSIEEAILWHGGEAAPMQSGFIALPAASRADLLFFLNSI